MTMIWNTLMQMIEKEKGKEEEEEIDLEKEAVKDVIAEIGGLREDLMAGLKLDLGLDQVWDLDLG